MNREVAWGPGTFTGKVVSIDWGKHTMLVKGFEGEKAFHISGAATEGMVAPHHWVRSCEKIPSIAKKTSAFS